MVHQAFEPGKIQGTKLLPFGGDHDGIGAFGRAIGALAIVHVRQVWLGLLHARWIVAAHSSPQIVQCRDQRNRRRVTGIIGVRFEGQPEHRNGLAAHRTAKRLDDLARHGAFALLVDRRNRFDQP